jgi:hypothetical protein
MKAARSLIAIVALAACGQTKPAIPEAGAQTAAASCDDYCAAMKVACKGANAQYYDDANCMKVCARLAPGTSADTTGNTVGCRLNAATTAAFEKPAIKPSCWMAGPLGIGGCGAECDTFCDVALSYCSAAEGCMGLPPFPSLGDCHVQCAAWKRQLDFTVPGAYGPAYTPGLSSDTLECRASHLLVNAFKSTDLQQLHCPHAANKSEICGPGNPVSDGGAGEGGTTDGAVRDGGTTDGGADDADATATGPDA